MTATAPSSPSSPSSAPALDPLAPRASRTPRDPTPLAMVAAELGLLCAGLGTVAGCSRLFIGWDFFGPLAVAVTASWAVSVITRRLGWRVGTATAVSAVLAVLVLTWVFAADTTFAGIPTPSTWTHVVDEMRTSFTDFSSLVAPVRATDGFLIVLAAVMWMFTAFADVAAFRYRGPVQAVVPYASAFVATGVLARDVGRTGAAVAFLAGIAVYAVTQRVLRTSELRWMRGEAARGTAVVAATATGAVVAAILAGLVLGPWLPGSNDAVVDLRSLGRAAGPRTVVSPFVGVRNLLGAQSDEVVFTVRSDRPAYWRLTSLSQYDTTRDIWVSRGTYREVDDGQLAPTPRGIPTTEVRQQFVIDSLGGPWLPAAYTPTTIDVDEDVSFDASTASIITRDAGLGSGTGYDVGSAVVDLTSTDLDASRATPRIDPIYTDDSGVSESVARTARSVTLGQPTPYQQAMALQRWFRAAFTYDTSVDYRSAGDPVAAFLRAKTGFCQQFASAYALMARSLGIPARVAVGFTQGDAVADVDDGGGPLPDPVDGGDGPGYVVRGRHAHAWPELYFQGIGWVAFEPTTGRGNPQAEAYTGVPAAQAEAPAPQASTTTVAAPSTTTPDGATTTSTPSNEVEAGTGAETDDGGTGAGRSLPVPVIAAGVVVLALVALGAAAAGRGRRRRKRLRGRSDGGRVAAAWDAALGELAAVGVHPASAETPVELARRVAADRRFRHLDDRPDSDTRPNGDTTPNSDTTDDRDATGDRIGTAELAAAMRLLATAETQRRYGRRAPDDDVGAAAESAARTVHDAVAIVANRRERVRQLVS